MVRPRLWAVALSLLGVVQLAVAQDGASVSV